MQYSDLTEQIIRCAYAVHNELGAGFLESVYERALLIEIREAGLVADSQVRLDVLYHGEEVGHFFADIIVEGCVVLELKAVESLAKSHEAQLVNYLTATGKDVGLLINFGPNEVSIRRKVRDLAKLPPR